MDCLSDVMELVDACLADPGASVEYWWFESGSYEDMGRSVWPEASAAHVLAAALAAGCEPHRLRVTASVDG